MLRCQSRFCSVGLLTPAPLTLRISFDREGNGGFEAAQAQTVELATRHMAGDLCELRDGASAPWSVSEAGGGIRLEAAVYDRFRESVTLRPSGSAAELLLAYSLEFLNEFEAHEIGTLLVRPGVVPAAPVVYLAGRQGVCPTQETVQREVLVDERVPLAGWIVKRQPAASCWLASDGGVSAIADWTRGEGRTWTGLTASAAPGWQFANYPATRTAWPAPGKFRKGDRLAFEARLTNGYLGDADRAGLLVSGCAEPFRAEQEFVYAVSILGTFRPYTAERLWFNRTALAVHHLLAKYYDWSWMRDNCHGYIGAAAMAGSAVHEAFACGIDQWLRAPLNAHGVWPHNNGLAFYESGELWKSAWASNLDTPAQLIEMAYQYAAQTGDAAFLTERGGELQRAADAMEKIVARNPFGRALPWIDEHGDTYMDLGFIRGEQTYLTAVFHRGFRRLAVLAEMLGMPGMGPRYSALAARLRAQANLPTEAGGLWDAAAGCYAGWRDPSGALQPPGGHETYGNLVAIGCGLCPDAGRAASILEWLDRNRSVIYEKNACPMTHSEVPYPQWEGGLTHSVPWICGWDLIARHAARHPRRETIWALYMKAFDGTDYPYLEGSGAQEAEARSNRGRIWDSWGFLEAVWGIHFGIEAAPMHAALHPSTIRDARGDSALYRWQGRQYDIRLTGAGNAIRRVEADGERWPSAVLPGRSCRVDVTVGEAPETPMILQMSPLLAPAALRWDEGTHTLSGRLLTYAAGAEAEMKLWPGSGRGMARLEMEGADLFETEGGVIRFTPREKTIDFAAVFAPG